MIRVRVRVGVRVKQMSLALGRVELTLVVNTSFITTTPNRYRGNALVLINQVALH